MMSYVMRQLTKNKQLSALAFGIDGCVCPLSVRLKNRNIKLTDNTGNHKLWT